MNSFTLTSIAKFTKLIFKCCMRMTKQRKCLIISNCFSNFSSFARGQHSLRSEQYYQSGTTNFKGRYLNQDAYAVMKVFCSVTSPRFLLS